MPSPSCRSPRHRNSDGRCRVRRSPPRFAGDDGRATSNIVRRRSREPFGRVRRGPADVRQGLRHRHPLGTCRDRQLLGRLPPSKRRCRSILRRTRTRRSSAPCQDWGQSSAPGCSASSGMTGLIFQTPSLARTTPARRRSRRPPVAAASCLLASRGTDVSATPAASGPSVRSRPHREHVTTTTSCVDEAKRIARPCAGSLTGWSGSSPAASRKRFSTRSTSPGSDKNRLLLDSLEPWGV